MNLNPRVSVITPTYNRADYLPVAIESVLSQTIADFELIVIDDGSTDETPKVMELYLSDPRIRYLRQDNQGQSAARNRGIEEATGEFICFLDSDNAWVDTKLEQTLKAFSDHPEADIVYGDFVVIDADGKEQGINRMKRYSGRITPQLIHDNCVSMNTTMTRARCFAEMGAFDPKDRLAEDYGLWLRFSTRYQFQYLPAVLGFYRVMENQISSDKDARFRANEQIIHQFLEAYPEALSNRERSHGLSRFYTRKGRYELFAGRVNQACRELSRAVRLDPFWSGPWRFAIKLLLTGLMGGRR